MVSVCWSGLRGPIAYSLLGGGIPTQNSGYVGHYTMSLLSLKLLCSVSALVLRPMEFKVLVLCPDPLEPIAPRDASSPVPLTVPSVLSSASNSESVNAFVPGSAASAATFALSLAPFQSIPICSHHRLGTCAPGRLFAFSHRFRIGRVAINCATLFFLRRIEVRIRTIPASFIAPSSDG